MEDLTEVEVEFRGIKVVRFRLKLQHTFKTSASVKLTDLVFDHSLTPLFRLFLEVKETKLLLMIMIMIRILLRIRETKE